MWILYHWATWEAQGLSVVINSLCYVEICSLYIYFEFLSWMILEFYQSFFWIYWHDHVFVFAFVNVEYHIAWFAYVETFLQPCNELSLIMVYILFMVFCCCCFLVFWIWFASMLLRIFASVNIVLKNISLYFSFMVMSWSGFLMVAL